MYLGQRTYRDKFRWGGMAFPIPKERGDLEKRWGWRAANDFDPFDEEAFFDDDDDEEEEGALAGVFDVGLEEATVFAFEDIFNNEPH